MVELVPESDPVFTELEPDVDELVATNGVVGDAVSEGDGDEVVDGDVVFDGDSDSERVGVALFERVEADELVSEALIDALPIGQSDAVGEADSVEVVEPLCDAKVTGTPTISMLSTRKFDTVAGLTERRQQKAGAPSAAAPSRPVDQPRAQFVDTVRLGTGCAIV